MLVKMPCTEELHRPEDPSVKPAPGEKSASRNSPVAQMPRSDSQNSMFLFNFPSCSGPHVGLRSVRSAVSHEAGREVVKAEREHEDCASSWHGQGDVNIWDEEGWGAWTPF